MTCDWERFSDGRLCLNVRGTGQASADTVLLSELIDQLKQAGAPFPMFTEYENGDGALLCICASQNMSPASGPPAKPYDPEELESHRKRIEALERTVELLLDKSSCARQ